MFCSLLSFLLLELACIIVTPTAESCLEESLPTQTGMAPGAAESGQEVEPEEVSLIQVGMIQGRMKGMASQAEKPITNYTKLAAQFAEFKASRRAVAPQLVQKSSFIPANGLLCLEGWPRAAEGALALFKANPTGRLFDDVYVATGMTCAQRGYPTKRGVNECYPDVDLYVKTVEEGEAFVDAVTAEIVSYAHKFSLSVDTAQLMFDCTCHKSSNIVAFRGSQCDALNNQPGAWIHHDPLDGKELMCDEGPFVLATLTMAILKSSGQLPMHLHDTVSATSCASLGFPVVYPPEDHCFPPMRMWTRTEMSTDPGIARSAAVEDDLFSGGFERYFLSRGISVNTNVLLSIPGCHCLPLSEVRRQYHVSIHFLNLQWNDPDCAAPENHPPVSDWFASPWTSPWPASL